MAAPNKQRIVARLLNELGKGFSDPFPPHYTVLDHLLLGVIQEGMAPSEAVAAYEQMRNGFFDMNEMRVSHPREIEERLNGVPHKAEKSKRILNILQFVFETMYTFDLESMKRKPLKQAHRQLSKIIGTNPFAVAAAVQRALGGHALPIDDAMCEVLAALRLIEEGETADQIRAGMEHLIAKAKGRVFCVVIGELAGDRARLEEVAQSVLPKSARKRGATAAKSKQKAAAGARKSAPKKKSR